MARVDHLPIFADAYRLALLVDQLVAEFSNRARPALGADLRKQVVLLCDPELVELAVSAGTGVVFL
jgi:hypothetical protein